MTNRFDPYHTGPATDPAAEPTPTELLAWLRGREAAVDRRLEAHREGMLQALDVRLEPVTKQLSELQLQADATDRRLDQHIAADQPHSAQSYYTNNPTHMDLVRIDGLVSTLQRRLDGHVGYHTAHNTAGLESRFEEHVRSVDETMHDLRQDFTHHLDLHEGLDGGEEPDGVMAGPSGDGQSDLDMIKWSQQLREAYRTFMRYVADPTVNREQFDLAIHDFREQVFELTKWMRIALSSREGQGAQTA